MKKWSKGFSLVEVLVVISIISILMAVLFVNINDARQQSRDAERKADLRNLQSAIELYKNFEGRYPEGCNGPTTNHTNIVFSGQTGTAYDCPDSTNTQYVTGLAPKYITTLPTDPKTNGVNSGYVYAVNDSGSAYKIMALDTVETETVDQNHEFFRCDASFKFGLYSPSAVDSPLDPAVCARSRTRTSGNMNGDVTTFNECQSSAIHANDYSLSGGFSTDNRGNNNSPEKGYEYDTDIVRCR